MGGTYVGDMFPGQEYPISLVRAILTPPSPFSGNVGAMLRATDEPRVRAPSRRTFYNQPRI